MKYLRLKSDEAGGQPTSALVTYCIGQVPPGGFTPTEMRSRIRVLDALEAADEWLALEDADATVLKNCVNASKWQVIHVGILAFTDAVNDLPSSIE